MPVKFTTEELADRWFDKREVTNLAGKYITSILLKREGALLEQFWAKDAGICLGFNEGFYQGRSAVAGYYDALVAATSFKSAFIRDLFPDELKQYSEEELFGVGQLKAMPITTPVIEIAGDGKTAKGIWHVQGSDNDVTPAGPISYWTLGFLCIDFCKEEGDWKLWHVLHAENIRCAMGENWVKPKTYPLLPQFAELEHLTLPPFNLYAHNYERYCPDRTFTPPPPIPEPYDTFEHTFSYGACGGGQKHDISNI